MKSKVCFARSLFYGEDRVNRNLRRLGRLGRALRLIGLIGALRLIGWIGSMRRGYHSPISPISLSPYLPFARLNKRDNLLAAVDDDLSQEINLLSEGRRVLHSAKMATMGST